MVLVLIGRCNSRPFFMRSPYFLVLIFSKLETILKINEKYFEKSLQLSK